MLPFKEGDFVCLLITYKSYSYSLYKNSNVYFNINYETIKFTLTIETKIVIKTEIFPVFRF